MAYFYAIVKADYLQRTRSYSFLITLAVTVFMAYSFIPANDANYTTLSASGYKGVYNSAWVGYVSAIMTTVMLSLYGFLLVNSGIKKDIDTEVGLIIATTPISNFNYLLSKQLSNYLVLLTITLVTLMVSIAVFFFRGTGYPFIISNFLLPYIFFAVPALFVVASMAIVGEVYLGKRSILQFIIYLTICGVGVSVLTRKSDLLSSGFFDPSGLSLMTKSVVQHINSQFGEDIKSVAFGFIFNGQKTYKTFIWEGLDWSLIFVASRLLWIVLGLLLINIASKSFHRFDFKSPSGLKKSKNLKFHKIASDNIINSTQFTKVALTTLNFNFGILPLIKTELILLIRQGKKWLWLINSGLWLSTIFVPLAIAHTYLLPILLFLQVTRWSELATKEHTNRVHYFAFASYKPMQRMLPAQMLAGFSLSLILCIPVIIRYLIMGDGFAVLNVINGALMIILLSVTLGIVTGGKKLYEVVFFFLTYCVLNRLPITDYLGSQTHQDPYLLVYIISILNLFLITISLVFRKYQIKHL